MQSAAEKNFNDYIEKKEEFEEGANRPLKELLFILLLLLAHKSRNIQSA
jgi:hypothetical protein